MADIQKNPQTGTGSVMVSSRLSQGQVAMLDKVCVLTGQTRTDLIREALQGFLYPLYARLTSDKKSEAQL